MNNSLKENIIYKSRTLVLIDLDYVYSNLQPSKARKLNLINMSKYLCFGTDLVGTFCFYSIPPKDYGSTDAKKTISELQEKGLVIKENQFSIDDFENLNILRRRKVIEYFEEIITEKKDDFDVLVLATENHIINSIAIRVENNLKKEVIDCVHIMFKDDENVIKNDRREHYNLNSPKFISRFLEEENWIKMGHHSLKINYKIAIEKRVKRSQILSNIAIDLGFKETKELESIKDKIIKLSSKNLTKEIIDNMIKLLTEYQEISAEIVLSNLDPLVQIGERIQIASILITSTKIEDAKDEIIDVLTMLDNEAINKPELHSVIENIENIRKSL